MYVIYEEDYDVKIIGYVETREEALIYCAINKQYSFDRLPKIEDIDINTKLEYRHAIRFIKTDSGWEMQNTPYQFTQHLLGELKDRENHISLIRDSVIYRKDIINISVYQTQSSREDAEEKARRMLEQYLKDKKVY